MRMALVAIGVAVSLASCGSGSRPVTHGGRATANGETSGAATSLATRLASAPCVRTAGPAASAPTIDARTAFVSVGYPFRFGWTGPTFVSLAPKPFGVVTTSSP
jgi:hypothetical protein